MIAVIFESWPAPDKMQTYLDMGASLGPQLEKIDGFISIERFRSVADRSGQTAPRRGEQFAERMVRRGLNQCNVHDWTRLRCLVFELGVTGLLQFQRQFLAAALDHSALRHDVDEIRHDVVQQTLIVGDNDHRAVL